MTEAYWRPLLQTGIAAPEKAARLHGGALWFDRAEVLSRHGPPKVRAASDLPVEIRDRLATPSGPVAGLELDRPRVMGILNVTPDSFSDGGDHDDVSRAVSRAAAMVAAGCDVLDIGGESTRPGAETVALETELARVRPVIEGVRAAGITTPISIDTRKAEVADAALSAGADMVNDVSGLTHDPEMAGLCAARGVPVCLMHMTGTPATMQNAPRYDEVLLDVYDHLARRIDTLGTAGISPERILADPGIGFGKTQAHNLALLRRITLFHALGTPLLVGVSRKGFIGRIGAAEDPKARLPGSLAVGLAMVAGGVQMLRVHDVAETCQALALWQAVTGGTSDDG